MQPSIFRQIRIATFAFLALIVVGMVVSAWLTVREQRILTAAVAKLERLYAFERTHIIIAQRIVTLRQSPEIDADGQREVRQRIDQLVVMTVSPDAVRLLQMIPARLPSIDAAIDREPLMELYQAVIFERQYGSKVMAEIESDTDSQRRFELAAPLGILVLAVLLLPVARQRIIKPIDAFAHQLARLAAGERLPVPVDARVSRFLLPVHLQFNDLARHLAELEAAQRARADSLEAEVRTTTRALLEQQRSLARAERLAATGELAASVAHELRNPLAGIQMTLTNLRGELADPELAARIDLVLEEVTRLSRLLNGLLDTARHVPEPSREIRLATLVDEMLALARCQVPAEIRLESRIPAELVVRLPPDRLRQALLNLVLNATTAVGGQGTVTIDAGVDGDRLRLRVADDGPGFPPEILERGIRPFFSTRERGTGLGLAMVRRFAADLGGEVRLANRQPHGAEVTIDLPGPSAS